MNITTKSSLLLLVGTVLFLGACGTENLDDASYLAQMASADASNDGEEKAEPSNEGMRGMAAQDPNQPEANMQAPQAVAVATPVVQLPTRFARLPGAVVAEAPIVTNSREDRNVQQDIVYQRDIIKHQPTINQHLIQKNLMINKKFHTTVYNRPSFRNDIAVANTVAETAEVLPTTEVTLPTAVGVGVGIGLGAGYGIGFGYNGWGVPPACARHLSGGFFRNCAVGPYLR